jgi:polyhydroxybutyrate depolymerase
MKTTLSLLALVALTLTARPALAADLVEKTWNVNGVVRKALVHLPAKPEGAPVIFAFHGHGGTMGYAARKFHFHTLWPEAIVVYPQGLPTVTGRDPQGAKPGWMMLGGGFLPNRDKNLFDAMLGTAKTDWKADPKRVFCTGHSNGAGFTYYLWGQYPELFAALAPVAGAGFRLIRSAKPCPLLVIGAKNDPIVKWESQQQAIEAAKKLNGAKYSVEVVIHAGGHEFPANAPEKIVNFFKKHTR